MTENKRLAELQKLLKFKTQSDFATKLGIKQGSLSDIYREKDGVGVSNSIKRILERDYSINVKWLETGVGEIFNNETAQVSSDPRQLEFNFNKWLEIEETKTETARINAESFQKVANTNEKLAGANDKLVDNSAKLVDNNAKLIDQLIDSIARIESKLDKKGGAEGVKDAVPKEAIG